MLMLSPAIIDSDVRDIVIKEKEPGSERITG